MKRLVVTLVLVMMIGILYATSVSAMDDKFTEITIVFFGEVSEDPLMTCFRDISGGRVEVDVPKGATLAKVELYTADKHMDKGRISISDNTNFVMYFGKKEMTYYCSLGTLSIFLKQ